MPMLSWTEVRQRAIKFSREWSENHRSLNTTADERAEAQTFWNDFFDVFGMRRRQVATFEERVKSAKDTWHRIDLFWSKTLLAEHKSRGEDLGKASSQAFNYIQELINNGRKDECPRYVVISDFSRILLYDLEPDDQLELIKGNAETAIVVEIPIRDFHQHIRQFSFMLGIKTHKLREQDPANLEAADIMARLHDTLATGGYTQPNLERLLVRLLFCLFADDTAIFNPDSFDQYIENRTRADGFDLGLHLERLFRILDTPEDKRTKTLDEELAAFPYVNGELFAEHLEFADFNTDMRNALLVACRFNWARISPAIFGSLFQGVMDSKERRQVGAHYTSERDILKLICPLFLDELHNEFEQIKVDRSNRRKSRLLEFQNKLGSLTFLDPACGCGNFLVIAYRELRNLELEVLKLLYGTGETEFLTQTEMDIQLLSKVDVDQFYGIEIDRWPSLIAETALWLTDHQANMRLSEAFGQIFQRIPLKKSPHILCANALRTDWNSHLPAKDCSYILGNPPFVGHHNQTEAQKADQYTILGNIQACGVLDFVCNWYVKATEYIKDTLIRCAFVSTNSITQGEQVGILWSELFGRYGLKIHFAHRTFAWQSEAKGKAHVHVVIIGFGFQDINPKYIYDYTNINGDPIKKQVSSISPYITEGSTVVISNRTNPICSVPSMRYGNKPTDGGHFIIEADQYKTFIESHPDIGAYIRPLMCSHEYLHGLKRWCLWLKDASPNAIRNIPKIHERVQLVREFRERSKAESTRAYANKPSIFRQIAQPKENYLLIPRVSSERRVYIPFGFFTPDNIVHDSCSCIPDATVYHFGVLTSEMHMAWVRQVCGRLESRFRYTKDIVYNNFPWPLKVTEKQKEVVEKKAQTVLDTRQKYLDAGNTLADLYDPLYTPNDLLKAHQALDKAVDQCYRKAPFTSECERIEYLFQLYETLVSPLALTEKKTIRKRKIEKKERDN